MFMFNTSYKLPLYFGTTWYLMRQYRVETLYVNNEYFGVQTSLVGVFDQAILENVVLAPSKCCFL